MTISLIQNIKKPTSKYLVFTSAGDHSNLYRWLIGQRNFDLWVCYYGEKAAFYQSKSDYYFERKGGKFPNLFYVYENWENILNQYEAIFIMDDDIVIDASSISRLFEIRAQYDLWLLQPAFHPRGKVSHPLTEVQASTLMRYVNFVEMACPLFRKDKLDEFMKVYDPVLVGWGTDWWYMELLMPGIENKVAVIDEMTCLNPHDWTKEGQREIDKLKTTPERIKLWDRFREKHNISMRAQSEFGSIKRPMSIFHLFPFISIFSQKIFYRWARKFHAYKERRRRSFIK